MPLTADRNVASDRINTEFLMNDDLCRYAQLPLMFVARYVLSRPIAHLTILVAVLLAVACSVGTQYGVKSLVDTFSVAPSGDVDRVWCIGRFDRG
jgi:hypothetical protein